MAAKATAEKPANDNRSWAQKVTKQSKPLEADISFATYNVMNLSAAIDPNDPKTGDRLPRLAQSFVKDLGNADIVALQEIQDDDGKEDTGVVSADKTLKKLVKAIVEAGGPKYEFTYIEPENNKDGGQAGSNIRQAFLYNPEKVTLRDAPKGGPNEKASFSKHEDGRIHLDQNPARIHPDYHSWKGSRKPLMAEFVENTTGESVFCTNLHLVSKRFGERSDKVREIQAKIVKGFQGQLVGALQKNKQLPFLVTGGDFNAFHNEPAVEILSSGKDFNLIDKGHDDGSFYTYVFHVRKGVEQENDLDHVITTKDLCNKESAEALLINAGKPEKERASDHNPVRVKKMTVRQSPMVVEQQAEQAKQAQRSR